jgi:hypothetical protein
MKTFPPSIKTSEWIDSTDYGVEREGIRFGEVEAGNNLGLRPGEMPINGKRVKETREKTSSIRFASPRRQHD